MAIVHRGRYVFGLLSKSGRYVSFYLLQTWEYNYRSNIQGLWFLLLRSHNAYKWVQINYLLSSWLLGVGNQEYCWIEDWAKFKRFSHGLRWCKEALERINNTVKYEDSAAIWSWSSLTILIWWEPPRRSTDIEADKQNLDNCIYNDKLSTLIFCFQGNGWQHKLGRS